MLRMPDRENIVAYENELPAFLAWVLRAVGLVRKGRTNYQTNDFVNIEQI